jgi:hypothetical protein
LIAPVGQLSAQALSSGHALQTMLTKLLVIPPVVRTRIALLNVLCSFLFTAAQTSMQVKHPMHLFILATLNTFGIFKTLFDCEKIIIVNTIDSGWSVVNK